MLCVWGKIWQKNRIKESYVAEDAHTEWPLASRIEVCVDEIIQKLDLPRPIWLPKNQEEMQAYGCTTFHQDHFIEPFPYEGFEIEIIKTDADDT